MFQGDGGAVIDLGTCRRQLGPDETAHVTEDDVQREVGVEGRQLVLQLFGVKRSSASRNARYVPVASPTATLRAVRPARCRRSTGILLLHLFATAQVSSSDPSSTTITSTRR